ncbi:MAG: polyribonucleotide nucleotidyltransferase [Dehalococcoidia bacterium]|nr:polyribonucleotide nucleotidyltransferase [Dehalococcoidia bacterium]
MLRRFECALQGRKLILETGLLAQQANGAVTVRIGDTVLLVTATMSAAPREAIDFLPLTVDFEERLYAVGRIPGSFFRREGRPGQDAVLSGRLTDRSIRPLFPKALRNEVQVIITVLSSDRENPHDVMGIVGAGAALAISDIPFDGPLTGCRIAAVGEELVVFPSYQQAELGLLELVVAGTKSAPVMLEAAGHEAPEELVISAVEKAQEVNRAIIATIEQMVREVGKTKVQFPPVPEPDPAIEARLLSLLGTRLKDAVFAGKEKGERGDVEKLEGEAIKALGEQFPKATVQEALTRLVKKTLRSNILEHGQRPDGRRLNQIRPLSAAVGLLPRAHGSGLFARGQTQVLTIATLGSLGERQKLDTLTPEETKRFLHHYNFPPFSVGEVRRLGTGRREVGHGALAERALEPVIPSEEEFPYTIRLVSETLSSNGSTSMASVCGSTLALMDAGVPIKAPVAGIAMGLVTGEGNRYQVLTDIQGLEDYLGDMDFKVAGTTKGITAVQLDIKLHGLPEGVLQETLAKAREARLTILKTLQEAIPQTRAALSPYAPQVLRISIPVDKIGALIGPGGKTIRGIIEATKATVDVEDDGTVLIGSPNGEALERARSMVEALTREVRVGDVFTGKVSRIASFGAFVTILPGKDGLVRVGELSDQRVASVEEEVKLGQEMTVKVIEVDSMGRINLSRRAMLVPEAEYQPSARPAPPFERRPFPGRPGGRPDFRPPPR